MPAQHHTLTPFRYEGHGHSVWSDGWDTPGAIVAAAIRNNVHIIGLSDHDTVEGLPALIDACHRANQTGHTILPMPSIEVTTTRGDILVALPFPSAAEQFIRDYPLWKKPADPRKVIEESILRYRALCVFLHPEAPYIRGFSQQDIDRMYTKIPVQLHRFLGLETDNWMTQVFFWNRHRVQQNLRRQNQQRWDMAPCAFSDYHRCRHVGKNVTTLYMKALTPGAFVEAFTTRQLTPTPAGANLRDFADAVITSVQADILVHF